MKTHFGFKQVDENQKSSLVGRVFSSVASKYDIMNDFMSVGLHRIWKDFMVKEVKFVVGQSYKTIDVAGGTGDVAFRILKKAKKQNVQINIEVADINPDMLAVGKDRALNLGYLAKTVGQGSPYLGGSSSCVGQNDQNRTMGVHNSCNFNCCDGENLSYPDQQFDYYTIAFGIRNFTNIQKGLDEAFRVLKTGGKFICLEFSQVSNLPLAKLYDFYSFKAIPKIGKLVAGDEASYQYLVESIRKFPNQENFKKMIEKAGFKNVSYQNFNCGVVAIHQGIKG